MSTQRRNIKPFSLRAGDHVVLHAEGYKFKSYVLEQHDGTRAVLLSPMGETVPLIALEGRGIKVNLLRDRR